MFPPLYPVPPTTTIVAMLLAPHNELVVCSTMVRARPSRMPKRRGGRPGLAGAGENGRMDEGRTHGPLPALLVGLTVVTGLVDAFSYLSLGHVFVANMTGNVVFLGFGLAGVGDVEVVASVVAVLAFAVGAALGGRWGVDRALHRGHLLTGTAAVQAVLWRRPPCCRDGGVRGTGTRLVLVGLLAVAMGGQNAVARRLAVPDLTTTVLTLTVTGLVADATTWPVRLRRRVPVVAMLGGALAGGVLLRWVGTSAPLWAAALVLACCALAALAAARRPQSRAWG